MKKQQNNPKTDFYQSQQQLLGPIQRINNKIAQNQKKKDPKNKYDMYTFINQKDLSSLFTRYQKIKKTVTQFTTSQKLFYIQNNPFLNNYALQQFFKSKSDNIFADKENYNKENKNDQLLKLINKESNYYLEKVSQLNIEKQLYREIPKVKQQIQNSMYQTNIGLDTLFSLLGSMSEKIEILKKQNLNQQEKSLRLKFVINQNQFKDKIKIQVQEIQNRIKILEEVQEKQGEQLINCQQLIQKKKEFDPEKQKLINEIFARWLCNYLVKFKRDNGFYIPKLRLKYIIYNMNKKTFSIDPRVLIYWALGLIQQPMSQQQKLTHMSTPTGELDPTIYVNPLSQVQRYYSEISKKNQKALQMENQQIFLLKQQIRQEQKKLNKYSQRLSIQAMKQQIKNNFISQNFIKRGIKNFQNDLFFKQKLKLSQIFDNIFDEYIGTFNYLMLIHKFQNGQEYDIQKEITKYEKQQKYDDERSFAQKKADFIQLMFNKPEILFQIMFRSFPNSKNAKQILQHNLFLEQKLNMTYIKIKILNQKQNQNDLKQKYWEQVVQYRNRCKYSLQLIKNVSFPDSSLLLASHNATRYIIIGFLCILFDLQKQNFIFQDIKYNSDLKNIYEFEFFLKQYCPKQINDVVLRIESFLKKSIEKIVYYQENSYEMIENHKIVTVKAKDYVQLIKSLYHQRQNNVHQYKKRRFQVIKNMEAFLIEHLFHKRIFKFKELQLTYEYKEKIDQFRQMEIAKFILEAILLNYTILQTFTISESYKIKQKSLSNIQQISFDSTRYFNNLPLKDFQEFKVIVDKNNPQKKLKQHTDIGSISLFQYPHQDFKQYIKNLVKDSQIKYEGSGIVYQLKTPKKQKYSQNLYFFGKKCVQIMQNIVETGRSGDEKSLKYMDWQVYMLLKQAKQRKKSFETLKNQQSTFDQISTQIKKQELQMDFKIEENQIQEEQININTKPEQKRQTSNVYNSKIDRIIVKLLNRIVNSSSPLLIIQHNCVRYMFIMMHCSLYLETCNVKKESNLNAKAQKKEQVMEFYQKAFQKLVYYCKNDKKKQNQAQYKENYQILTMKQQQIFIKVVQQYKKFNPNQKFEMSVVFQQSKKQQITNQIIEFKKSFTFINIVENLLDLSNNYLFRFKSFQNKETQVKHIMNNKQKVNLNSTEQKKQFRLREVKDFLFEMIMTNYSWIQMILLFFLSEYQKNKNSQTKKTKIQKFQAINHYLEKIKILVANISQLTSQKKKIKLQNQKQIIINIFQKCMNLQEMQKQEKKLLKNQIQDLLKNFENTQKIRSFFCENKYINSKLDLEKQKSKKKEDKQKITYFFGFGILSRVRELLQRHELFLAFPEWKQTLNRKSYLSDLQKQIQQVSPYTMGVNNTNLLNSIHSTSFKKQKG